VSSAAEAIEAVRQIKAAGLWGVKFYTSMDPTWIAPAAAEALQTATINVARLVGADKRTGSIAVGKEADLILVDGDVSRDLGALRRVVTVVSDGVVMDADALRKAAGYTGRPK
jgi:predicted amidohydrolase YtcJ